MRKTEALAQYIPKHSVVAVHTCRLGDWWGDHIRLPWQDTALCCRELFLRHGSTLRSAIRS